MIPKRTEIEHWKARIPIKTHFATDLPTKSKRSKQKGGNHIPESKRAHLEQILTPIGSRLYGETGSPIESDLSREEILRFIRLPPRWFPLDGKRRARVSSISRDLGFRNGKIEKKGNKNTTSPSGLRDICTSDLDPTAHTYFYEERGPNGINESPDFPRRLKKKRTSEIDFVDDVDGHDARER